MPDLSELVMRWLGDWPDDQDESASSKQRRKPRPRKRDAKMKSEAPQLLKQLDEHPFSDVSAQAGITDITKDNNCQSSASRRKNRKKKKK